QRVTGRRWGSGNLAWPCACVCRRRRQVDSAGGNPSSGFSVAARATEGGSLARLESVDEPEPLSPAHALRRGSLIRSGGTVLLIVLRHVPPIIAPPEPRCRTCDQCLSACP